MAFRKIYDTTVNSFFYWEFMNKPDIISRLLTPREKEVISMRFGIPEGNEMSLVQIGNCLGLTRERVRQIEKAALKKIKEHPSTQFMKDFL